MSTTTERMVNYLKCNKFMTGTIVTGIVAVLAIAGVMAATNNSSNDQAAKPETAQTTQQDGTDVGKDTNTEVAAVPTDTGSTSEVLGESTSGFQNQAPSAQTATVVLPAAASLPSEVETASDVEPTTPVGQQADPTEPATETPADPAVPEAPVNVAPAVNVTTPTDGATVGGAEVAVSATATDDKGVASVQFRLDGTDLMAADTTEPYGIIWDTTSATNGTHTLAAVATDSDGVATTSVVATVTVSNVVAPPVDPTKFDKARVSLTFDDGWKSIHENGLPILKKYGLVSTQYINGEPTLKSDPTSPVYDYWTGYMDSKDVKDFATAGHEIAWHTNTHVFDLVTATAEQRAAELKPTTDFLNLLMTVNVTMTDNLAAPFGTQSAESAAAAKANGFNSYRTTYDGYNTKANLDLMRINVKNVCGVAGVEACNGIATTAAEVAGWVASAQAQNAWLVIVYHEVTDASVVDSEYAVTVAEFDAQMSVVKQSNVEVVTVQQAVAQLKTQL